MNFLFSNHIPLKRYFLILVNNSLIRLYPYIYNLYRKIFKYLNILFVLAMLQPLIVLVFL